MHAHATSKICSLIRKGMGWQTEPPPTHVRYELAQALPGRHLRCPALALPPGQWIPPPEPSQWLGLLPFLIFFFIMRVVKGGVHYISPRALTTTLPVRPSARPARPASVKPGGQIGQGRKTGKHSPCRRGQLAGPAGQAA